MTMATKRHAGKERPAGSPLSMTKKRTLRAPLRRMRRCPYTLELRADCSAKRLIKSVCSFTLETCCS